VLLDAAAMGSGERADALQEALRAAIEPLPVKVKLQRV